MTWLQDVWFDWRGELKPLLLLLIVGLGVGAVFILKQSGPSTIEIGRIVRFASYADRVGEQPIVVVQTSDGRQLDIPTTRESLNNCSIGHQIQIVRRDHSISVAPVGCTDK